MAQAYDAVIATIVVASDATSVTKTMVKSTTWREGTSGEWKSTSCTLEAGKTYQFRTPNSGSGSGTTAVLPNIKASVTVGWDTSGSTITTVGDYFLYSYAYNCTSLTSLSVPDTSGLTTVGDYFMVYYARGCSSLTSLSVPDTSGLTTVGDYFMYYYADGCTSLTSLSVPDTSGLTTVGDYFMAYYARSCTSLTSLSVPDTSGLTTVGDYFMSYYAYGCSSLTSLILKGDTGWFSSHNISWSVPSSRLNYLYGYCEPAYLTNWQGLTATGKTLYTNYIQSSSYVKALGNSERTLYLKSFLTNNSQRGLYLEGGSASSTGDSQRNLYLGGCDTSNSERGLYISGFDTSNSGRSLYMQGFADDFYSRESADDLESNDTTLATTFSEQDYTDVENDDNVYVDLQGTARYMKFLFKEFNENESNTQKFTITWKGKSSVAPSSSTVYLQVYNRTLGQWETLASNNTSPANTKFTLTGTQPTNLEDYYDANYVISVRVYQDGMV